MVQLVTISPLDLPKYITISYWNDYKLWTEYHIKEFGTCMEACEATALMIAEAETHVRLNYFKVVYNEIEIGYTVTFENCLYSFGIGMDFRKVSVLKEWIAIVRKMLNYNFCCGLYSNNKRAIAFLEKNGMFVKSIKDDGLVILMNQYSSQN